MKAIVDYRTSDESISRLGALGCEVVKTKPLKSVYPEIDGHADIQVHKAGDKLICAPEVYEYYRKIFPNVICGSARLSDKYPHDIAYNACRIGNYAVCNAKYTAREILSEYARMGVRILNTRQGYAACSICRVSDTAAITADMGLYKLLSDAGIDTLLISPGHISLYGTDGFIGGASGLLRRGLLAFNGAPDTHPDGHAIAEFCEKHGTEIVELTTDKLTDIGGIII